MSLKNTLSKPNPALVMMPRTGKLTGVGRKVYNVLLKKTHEQIQVIKGQGRAIEGEHLFVAPLSELADVINDSSSNSTRDSAKKYLREMRRIEVDWESPDADTGVIWRSMGLLSEVQLELRSGATWVRWALPPTLLAAVSDPERFTVLDLDVIAKLSGYSTIALYEICSRYRDNPSHVTSRNSTSWWTDALSNTVPAKDKVTGEFTRREWRKFKAEFVSKAIIEINEKSDLTLELLEFKTGKAITEAQFGVRKKAQPTQKLPKIQSDMAETATRLAVPLEYIARLVKEGFGSSELKIGLFKLEARTQATNLGLIDNRAAYLRKILNEGRMGKPKFEIVPATSACGTPQQTSEYVKSPAEEIRAQMQEQFLGLPLEGQNVWANAAAEGLRARQVLTPSMARKIQAGDWRTGLLLNAAVNAYAVGTYGPAWLTPPA